MKIHISILVFFAFLSCSVSSNSTPELPTPPTDIIPPELPLPPTDIIPPDISSALEVMDKKYPAFAIKLDEFKIDSKLTDGRITPEEKMFFLKSLDFIRFVINTPEFEKEVLLEDYKYRSAQDINGKYGKVKKYELYDKNQLLKTIKNAKFTTYIMKGNFTADSDAEAVATPGPHFYADTNPNNPNDSGWENYKSLPSWQSDRYTELLLIYPNNNWTEITGDFEIQKFFHELLHNMGIRHINKVDLPDGVFNPADTANTLSDAFLIVMQDRAWRNKYSKELENFNYYQLKYKDYTTNDTTL